VRVNPLRVPAHGRTGKTAHAKFGMKNLSLLVAKDLSARI